MTPVSTIPKSILSQFSEKEQTSLKSIDPSNHLLPADVAGRGGIVIIDTGKDVRYYDSNGRLIKVVPY